MSAMATTKTLAGSVSSSDDGIASTFNVSPAVSLTVDCASVESGSFGASRQTSVVTDSPSGSDSLATSTRTVAPAQRSQRLLVRVPSTGVVVVIPASALAFGRHKQRGKPLILCAGFDGAQDAATAVCPDPGNCRHVHADLKLATPFHPHRRSAALLGQYPRMPAGTTEAVLSPDGTSVERMPAERMLLTRALESARRPIPQCEHFLNAVCNRGSECDFAHVVGGTSTTQSKPQQQQHSKVASLPKHSSTMHAPRDAMFVTMPAPVLPPQQPMHPYPHRYDRGPCVQQQQLQHYHQQQVPSYTAASSCHGVCNQGHTMPHWQPSTPSMQMPSAAMVLAGTRSAPSAAAVLGY